MPKMCFKTASTSTSNIPNWSGYSKKFSNNSQNWPKCTVGSSWRGFIKQHMDERRGRRRGWLWGTRSYHWPGLRTLHFPLRKEVCWAKLTHSAALGLGEDSAEEQPGRRHVSSRNTRHVKDDIPTSKEAVSTKMTWTQTGTVHIHTMGWVTGI